MRPHYTMYDHPSTTSGSPRSSDVVWWQDKNLRGPRQERATNPDMPFLNTKRPTIFYRLEGSEGKPALILSHSIGTDHGMWEPQIGDLIQHFHILRYDTRGHGASDAPAGDYTID